MKKLTAFLLSFFVLCLAACGRPAQPEVPVPPTLPWNYDCLTESQKELYDRMADGTITTEEPYLFPEPLSVEDSLVWEMNDVISLYAYNHPTGEWCSPAYWLLYNEEGTEALGVQCAGVGIDNRGHDEEMKAAFDKTEEELLEQLPSKDAPDAEKIKAIAELLAERVEYCYPVMDPLLMEGLTPEEEEMTRYARSEYGAMVNGWAVCEGYARAFQYLADKLDVISLFMEGDTAGGSHAWNMVWLDGNWYHVDVTWMDGGEGNPIRWEWLLLSDEEISTTHWNIHWANTRGMDHEPLFERPYAESSLPYRGDLLGI